MLRHTDLAMKIVLTYNFKSNVMIQNEVKAVNVGIEQIALKPIHILFINDIVELALINRESETRCEEIYNFICQMGLRPGRKIVLLEPGRKTAFLKVAIEIAKGFTENLIGNIEFMTIEGGEAIVAHYRGTREEIMLPYQAITEWLILNKKKAKGKPFMAYQKVLSLGNDKEEFLTDTYQLIEDSDAGDHTKI